MAILSSFGGLVPRRSWHQLPENAATIAHDVKLRNGRIEAWREPQEQTRVGEDTLSFHMAGCCVLAWDKCVSVADYPPDFARVFLTGRSQRPEVVTLRGCVPTYRFLGVPPPTTAPKVGGVEGTGRDAAVRTYVYTYLNEFGEESAPSPVSVPLSIIDGTPVIIDGFAPPPPGYGIIGVNIYRTATAARNGDEKEQTPGTIFLAVVYAWAEDAPFTDTLLERHLGVSLTTRENRVPPAQLRSIRHIGGTATLVGIHRNRVSFSQNFEPANWPAEFDLTLDDYTVHVETGDGVVYVSTLGCPVVIDGRPICEGRSCRQVTVARAALPDIGCGYPNGSTKTPYGMVYSSPEGLILLQPSGETDILTASWFGPDEWRKLQPESVRLAYWRGAIVCVTNLISFMLMINAKPFGDYELGALTTFSDRPHALEATDAGELLFLMDGGIYQWDAGTSLRPYRWESRELALSGATGPTSAKVRGDKTTFTLLSPWEDAAFTRVVTKDDAFRIRRLGRHLNYRVRLEGTGTVEFVDLGSSFLTVNQGA